MSRKSTTKVKHSYAILRFLSIFFFFYKKITVNINDLIKYPLFVVTEKLEIHLPRRVCIICFFTAYKTAFDYHRLHVLVVENISLLSRVSDCLPIIVMRSTIP
ncbi:hypothetical protein PUN28_010044 [Cardiocondyla obscurior]|uniref:Uncharacterized protein n=1 Tax=Cardiocondyla obscurior TaxID=286306 RepID=A0AAW2FN80_9HYME